MSSSAETNNWMMQFLGSLGQLHPVAPQEEEKPASQPAAEPPAQPKLVLPDPTILEKSNHPDPEPSSSSAGAAEEDREEVRYDPTDGAPYKKEIFVGLYGEERGEEEWEKALLERRVDKSDGQPYPKQSFIDLYGGTKQWSSSETWKPTQQQVAAILEALKAREQQQLEQQESLKRGAPEDFEEAAKRFKQDTEPPPEAPVVNVEVEAFLRDNGLLGDPPACRMLREAHRAIQKHVMHAFPPGGNPSGLVRSRLQTATEHFAALTQFIMQHQIAGDVASALLDCDIGIQKGAMRLPYVHAGTLEHFIMVSKMEAVHVEEYIKDNNIDERAARVLRDSDPAIQREVTQKQLKHMKNPNGALVSRIKMLEGQQKNTKPDGGKISQSTWVV
eukprot:gnl/MRDRNA2_/MRDRNA2_81084_c0_seq3.p1 gnl/MRDRNA2_/MRDRNA2_81084_c0~~gnl/MRDRNA2_/MRDRNA2_81084_c0_seq3.p1  ORF type:complete len:388 (-),score=85.96 gnl/MRDRNA2_/MRDRNA2_81084_c0_seq3:67-1230(-)